MHILVIEDEDSLRNLVSSYLKRYETENSISIELTTISNPVEGMYEISVRGAYYDLITLDVRMPKLHGDEIYHALKKTQPLLAQSILFITGFSRDLKKRFQGEKLNILDKPFRYEQFVEKLESITA